jgi:hypothetical protein
MTAANQIVRNVKKRLPLALLWQILAVDRRDWIPESGFQ